MQWNLLYVGFPFSWNQKWGCVCANIVILKKYFKRMVPGNIGCDFKREQQMLYVPANCHEEDMLVFTLVERFAVTPLCWAEIRRGFSSYSAEYLSAGTWWTGSPCVLTVELSSQLGESESGYLVLAGSLVWTTFPVKDKEKTLWGMLDASEEIVDPFSWSTGILLPLLNFSNKIHSNRMWLMMSG